MELYNKGKHVSETCENWGHNIIENNIQENLTQRQTIENLTEVCVLRVLNEKSIGD